MFRTPTPAEIAALDTAAAYLRRAGTEAATRLLAANGLGNDRLDLIESIRIEMQDSAALCECLIDLFDGWQAPADPS